MNCPSRNDDDDLGHPGWNQNPRALSADTTTRADLGGIANARSRRQSRSEDPDLDDLTRKKQHEDAVAEVMPVHLPSRKSKGGPENGSCQSPRPAKGTRCQLLCSEGIGPFFRRCFAILRKFGGFVGPGFMIAVAYVDPGNYATDVSAGAQTRFQLLFVVLLSNIFAVLLQSLALRLGTVTGMNLAEHCRANLPSWLNILLYMLAEAAIIATDFAEVIGSAIALNILLHIPLYAGCVITLVDVLIILAFYNPDGSLRQVRYFEFFVAALVFAVVICFCIQLSLIQSTSVGEVFRGYLPSSAVVEGQGLYLSCGILGATVMPHSLYLGSGMVQARLREFDRTLSPPAGAPTAATTTTPRASTASQPDEKDRYYPSLAAIRYSLKYSILELGLALSVFALFVNSAILIVAGTSLSASSTTSAQAADADLFGIASLLASSVAPAAATIFALALFFSGTSAGIVCTIAGQMVSEGQIRWRARPWVRRLLTRAISIVPSIVIAVSVGRDGLSAALNASQVCLSVILPFVSAPLVWFTARARYMHVGGPEPRASSAEDGAADPGVAMQNHWVLTALAVAVWLVITVMNVALLVLLGLGGKD